MRPRERERAAIAAGDLAAHLLTVRRLMLDPTTPAELLEGMQRMVADVDAVIRGLSPRDQVIVALWRAIAEARARTDAGEDDPALWVLEVVARVHPDVAELLDVGDVRDAIADWHYVYRAPKEDQRGQKTLASTRSESFRVVLEDVGIPLTDKALREVLRRAGVTSTRTRLTARGAERSRGTPNAVHGSDHEDRRRRRPRP